MLKINIIAIGKIKEKYIIDGIAEFSKRLSKYINLNIIELQEEVDNSTAIKKESDKILVYLSKIKSYNILLDLKGKFIDSIELSNKLFDLTLNYSEISFIIGGSRGVSREVKEKADYLLAFSKLTFPHQLFRLILLEQIYRAICISKNIKYHK